MRMLDAWCDVKVQIHCSTRQHYTRPAKVWFLLFVEATAAAKNGCEFNWPPILNVVRNSCFSFCCHEKQHAHIRHTTLSIYWLIALEMNTPCRTHAFEFIVKCVYVFVHDVFVYPCTTTELSRSRFETHENPFIWQNSNPNYGTTKQMINLFISGCARWMLKLILSLPADPFLVFFNAALSLSFYFATLHPTSQFLIFPLLSVTQLNSFTHSLTITCSPYPFACVCVCAVCGRIDVVEIYDNTLIWSHHQWCENYWINLYGASTCVDF